MSLSLAGDGTVTGVTAIGDVSSTELGYLDGVTSGLQTQIDGKALIEDSTWTATLPNGGTFNGPSTVSAPYRRVGNLVTLFFDYRMASVPNNSSAFTIGGLPYAAVGTASIGVGLYARGLGSGEIVVYVSGSLVYFFRNQTSTSGTYTQITNATPAAAVNNFDIAFTVTYRMA